MDRRTKLALWAALGVYNPNPLLIVLFLIAAFDDPIFRGE